MSTQRAAALRSSFIICTRDRPDDLLLCVRSIVAQECLPHELIIIDASTIAPQNQSAVSAVLAGFPIRFEYQFSARANLPFQRNLGIEAATGDILFFLDDDVILFPDFHGVMLELYQRYWHTGLGGIQGTALNAPQPGFKRWLFQTLFLPGRGDSHLVRRIHSSGYQHIGPIPATANGVVKVEMTSGYTMSFKREICDQFRFDVQLEGYAVEEDIDFSYRVSRQYYLLQALLARVIHTHSDLARLTSDQLMEMFMVNHYYLFRKNVDRGLRHKLAFGWATFGQLMLSAHNAIRFRDRGNLTGTLRGLARILRGETIPVKRINPIKDSVYSD